MFRFLLGMTTGLATYKLVAMTDAEKAELKQKIHDQVDILFNKLATIKPKTADESTTKQA